MREMYRAYIPEHRDFKKNIAKLEVEKLASTTYGLDYLKVTDVIDFLVLSLPFPS